MMNPRHIADRESARDGVEAEPSPIARAMEALMPSARARSYGAALDTLARLQVEDPKAYEAFQRTFSRTSPAVSAPSPKKALRH